MCVQNVVSVRDVARASGVLLTLLGIPNATPSKMLPTPDFTLGCLLLWQALVRRVASKRPLRRLLALTFCKYSFIASLSCQENSYDVMTLGEINSRLKILG